jgi:hypothetical protein
MEYWERHGLMKTSDLTLVDYGRATDRAASAA